MKTIAMLLCLLALQARAQVVEMSADSPWSAWGSDVAHQVAAQPLRRDSTTGALEAIPGQRTTIGPLPFRQLGIIATFPGLKTAPMTVAGVRLFHSATGTGWEIPEHQVNATFPEPIIVPAGRPLSCVYTMPLAGKGVIRCEVGAAK